MTTKTKQGEKKDYLVRLFLSSFVTLLFLSGGFYLLTFSFIYEEYYFFLIGCAGISMGILGLTGVYNTLIKMYPKEEEKQDE